MGKNIPNYICICTPYIVSILIWKHYSMYAKNVKTTFINAKGKNTGILVTVTGTSYSPFIFQCHPMNYQ